MTTESSMANKIWGAIGLVALTGVGLYHAENGRLPFTTPVCKDAARAELEEASSRLDEIIKRLRGNATEQDLRTIGLDGFQAAMMLGLDVTLRIEIKSLRSDLIATDGPQRGCRTETNLTIHYATRDKHNTFSTTIQSGLVFVPSEGGVRILESQTLGAILSAIAVDAMRR